MGRGKPLVESEPLQDVKLNLGPATVRALDAQRGSLSRSAFIRLIVRQELDRRLGSPEEANTNSELALQDRSYAESPAGEQRRTGTWWIDGRIGQETGYGGSDPVEEAGLGPQHRHHIGEVHELEDSVHNGTLMATYRCDDPRCHYTTDWMAV